jgi:hypothetical protein
MAISPVVALDHVTIRALPETRDAVENLAEVGVRAIDIAPYV